MKIIAMFWLLFVLLAPACAAAVEVESPKACQLCGMDRTAFAHSRMLIIYADGTTMGTCSLHCAAEELQQNPAKSVRALLVADYLTKELIDAKTATWVVGGQRPGVMTALAKWAFAEAEEAGKFMAANGGMINSFTQALNAATLEVLAQAEEDRAVERELLRQLQL